MKNKKLIILLLIVLLLSAFYYLKRQKVLSYSYAAINSKGDVNGDGKITSLDYLLLRKYLLKISTLDKQQLDRADANSDSTINSLDYILIKKVIMGTGTIPTAKPTIMPTPISYNDSSAKVVNSKYSYTVANINVSDYGADMTGSKDSTAAFKKALAAAETCISSNTCGGTVYVPKGKYLLTETIKVPLYVSLVGDLNEGTTDGTILMIKHGDGITDVKKSAIIVQVFGSIQNICFWYPDQKIDGSGNAIIYPPTIIFGEGADGVTLENLYFVNSYIAMDFASYKENNSIEFIRRIYGTPLSAGIINDTNYDTIKMENINFSPKYWLNSGLSGVPTSNQLYNVLMNFYTMPSAIILQRLDWFFLANINIDGYFMGIRLAKSSRNSNESGSGAEGELFDSTITDCYYPIYAIYSKHVTITGTTLRATGGQGARGIHITPDCDFDYSINNSTISSTGDYAVYHDGKRAMSIVGSTITGRIGKGANSKISLVGNKLSNTNFESCNTGNADVIAKKDYKRRVVTKPKSTNLIKISAKPNTDITNSINDAIKKLKSTGGIVYIPNGSYIVSNNITVPSGIEIRGAVPWAHHNSYNGSTVLKTTYKGNSLFTLLSNSGINGIDIVQIDNAENSNSIKEYPYVIKGNGSNIYIMNVAIPSVWNGIDLTGCDNHYVEHIWGEFYNIGINVGGGSKNGIIRDSHFTINVLRNQSSVGIKRVLTNQTLMNIGSSSGEVILNTFIFGPGVGYHFDGATDFYAVGIGADFANVGIKLSGRAIGDIINPLLVIKPFGTWTVNGTTTDLGVNLKDCHYIVSTASYSGMVRIYNSLNWGSNEGIAIDLNGTGDYHFNSGIIENSASPAIRTSNAAQSFIGMVIGYPRNSSKIEVNPGASGLYMEGNICIDGSGIGNQLSNRAGIAIGIVDAKTNCN